MTRPLRPESDGNAPDAAAPPGAPLRRGRGVLRRTSGLVVHWMPVWIPLGMLAQLGLLGLRPALREDARLRAAEVRLDRRLDGLREERGELERDLAAIQDPIFRERLRRLRDRL